MKINKFKISTIAALVLEREIRWYKEKDQKDETTAGMVSNDQKDF